eukprot:c3217_g1_i1 orf=3-326(-)
MDEHCQTYTSSSNGGYGGSGPSVEVSQEGSRGNRFRVRIRCAKGTHLLERLIAAMEQVGLFLVQADIAVRHDAVHLDAVGVQEGEVELNIDTTTLRSSLLNIINKESG